MSQVFHFYNTSHFNKAKGNIRLIEKADDFYVKYACRQLLTLNVYQLSDPGEGRVGGGVLCIMMESQNTEGLPGVLGNKGTLAKYRREQGNISQFLGTGEQNSKH